LCVPLDSVAAVAENVSGARDPFDTTRNDPFEDSGPPESAIILVLRLRFRRRWDLEELLPAEELAFIVSSSTSASVPSPSSEKDRRRRPSS
jgi:hypothetical protein